MKRPLEIGEVEDGLYLLCSHCLKNSVCFNTVMNTNSEKKQFSVSSLPCNEKHCNSSFSTLNINKTQLIPVFSAFHKDDVDLMWHNRLGHVPFSKMKDISSIPAHFSSKQPFLCNICPMARQTRLPFPEKTTFTKHIFELLHIDLWGPYHVATHDKYKYFLTMVDDYSKCTWTHMLSCKSNCPASH